MSEQKKERILTIAEAAEILGLSENRVWQFVNNKRLPATRFGGMWSIKESDLTHVANRKNGTPKRKAVEVKNNLPTT